MLPLENHGVKCMSMGFFMKVRRSRGLTGTCQTSSSSLSSFDQSREAWPVGSTAAIQPATLCCLQMSALLDAAAPLVGTIASG